MTDQANLERAYRRLLAWYPREFRQEHEQEILAVLMASAPDGQRRPGLVESADLIRSGLWMRLCPSVPRSAYTVPGGRSQRKRQPPDLRIRRRVRR